MTKKIKFESPLTKISQRVGRTRGLQTIAVNRSLERVGLKKKRR
ncbi:MAG: hypothetical protein AABX24_06130 [Nanoarchaeota archaeon]